MARNAFKPRSFSFMQTRYRPENAWWMATLSKLSYLKCDDDNGTPDAGAILEELQQIDPDFEEVLAFNKNSSQAILTRHADHIVAAFRGTDELGDWWDNLNALPADGPFGSVHQGFQNAMMDVWPAMRAKLRQFRRDSKKHKPLWLTGHSLGGAMATLAAAQLIHADQPFYGVYTFGQPRCGDRDFARVFNLEAKDRCFRFQNNNDIVTRVPARVMGYSHVGKFIYISAKQDLSMDIGWWYQFVDSIRGAVEDIGEKGIDGVKDHDVDKYLQAIQNWGDRPPTD